jgi:hypothetical protein
VNVICLVLEFLCDMHLQTKTPAVSLTWTVSCRCRCGGRHLESSYSAGGSLKPTCSRSAYDVKGKMSLSFCFWFLVITSLEPGTNRY